MTRKNWVKAIVLGTALAVGGNAYAQSKEVQPEVIATFEYTSHRPEKEYNGKTYQYNILSDGTICQAGKPNTKFARTWFYDVDGDGEFTTEDLAARKEGKLIFMHPEFNKVADAESKRILENMVVSTNFDRLKEKQKNSKKVLGYPYNERVEDAEKVKEYADAEEKWRSQYPVNERVLDSPDYVQETFPEPKEKVNPVWSLIAGANSNSAFDKYSLSLGARVNPFRNEKIGLGLTADFGFGKDKQVDAQTIPLSRGKEFVGEINEIDNQSFGLSTELQLYNLIVGGGFDYSKHISETNEKVIRGEEVLESNTNSVSVGKVYGKGYLGLEFQPTKKFGIGATVGYHGKDGLTFGVRTKLKLNNRR